MCTYRIHYRPLHNQQSFQMDSNNLSDNELRQQLTALGQSVGPLTPLTRTLYKKKLKNLLRMQGDAPINSPTQPAGRNPRSSVEGGTEDVPHNAQLFGVRPIYLVLAGTPAPPGPVNTYTTNL
ncbi:unnamed protein product [Cylicocyclus nassatus]|uniref:LEM domain-containing protein n=1 Tax=Cylicocyclus nassatus TaxID=53992 RepID=A0AA36DUW0_CYLNA|nr:unnamed protein product [Cylicocyclus nassatus]